MPSSANIVYDVALSFAGEDRKYVEDVANSLKTMGINVFYDAYERTDLWGKNLYTHLSKIYKDDSRFVVMFISKAYADKVWTNHERENAQARAFVENSEYILPARFDDTGVPGILATTGYISLAGLTSLDFASLIAKKVRDGDYWQRELAEASHLCSRVFMEAHRGAFLWRKDVVAVFDNRLADRDDPYIQAVYDQLSKLPLLARSGPEEHPIMALFRTSEGGAGFKIHELVWEKFSERIGVEGEESSFLNRQKEIADRVTGTARYMPSKGDIR